MRVMVGECGRKKDWCSLCITQVIFVCPGMRFWVVAPLLQLYLCSVVYTLHSDAKDYHISAV